MSVFRGTGDSRRVQWDRMAPVPAAHQEERRAARSGWVGTGTLACNRCDAPVALTAGPVIATDTLTCPFCSHRAPARDFLSLAPPTRPARVEVRAIYDAR
ncbi:MAG TPA: hypothetical protein VG294_18910 [Solirubrobacteraceae bacterium]|jgi:hypothetical protein|nr:hypothetical protein [Solirubrobacteraceae bacterium]